MVYAFQSGDILQICTEILIILLKYLISELVLFVAFMEIFLFFKYRRYNKVKNSQNISGRALATRLLKEHGLEKIRVKCMGSVIFGNSYSHFFKKIRLRRFTWNKTTITAMAIATQKVELAVLDKNKDPMMKTRIAFTPLIYLGPIAALPMILLGIIVDIIVFAAPGTVFTLVAVIFSLVFYLISFILTITELKTEKKAQRMAISELREKKLATDEELNMMSSLFKIYNIQYVNNVILSILELLVRILQLFQYFNQSSSPSFKFDDFDSM